MDEKYVDMLEAENKSLKDKVRELSERRDRIYVDMLSWRGIYLEYGDKACERCCGSGVVTYGDTTTWRGGIGLQKMTQGVCDSCWGTGCDNRKGANLREMEAAIKYKSGEG